MIEAPSTYDEAAARMAAALSEVGYPPKIEVGPDLLTYDWDPLPPEDVFMRAVEVCGIPEGWWGWTETYQAGTTAVMVCCDWHRLVPVGWPTADVPCP